MGGLGDPLDFTKCATALLALFVLLQLQDPMAKAALWGECWHWHWQIVMVFASSCCHYQVMSQSLEWPHSPPSPPGPCRVCGDQAS